MTVQTAATVGEALSGLVAGILEDAAMAEPPVDAIQVAHALGIEVRVNRFQSVRGRIVEANGIATITIRPEPRRERSQWSIAREIGEYLIPRMTDGWPEKMARGDATSRDGLAKQFAMRLLVPTGWYERDVRRLDGDLSALKLLYRTASYEILAMRLLDVLPATRITIFDNGRQTRRTSNLPHRPPGLTQAERDCWTRCRQSGKVTRGTDERCTVRAWPIHENGWRREIVVTEEDGVRKEDYERQTKP